MNRRGFLAAAAVSVPAIGTAASLSAPPPSPKAAACIFERAFQRSIKEALDVAAWGQSPDSIRQFVSEMHIADVSWVIRAGELSRLRVAYSTKPNPLFDGDDMARVIAACARRHAATAHITGCEVNIGRGTGGALEIVVEYLCARSG